MMIYWFFFPCWSAAVHFLVPFCRTVVVGAAVESGLIQTAIQKKIDHLVREKVYNEWRWSKRATKIQDKRAAFYLFIYFY